MALFPKHESCIHPVTTQALKRPNKLEAIAAGLVEITIDLRPKPMLQLKLDRVTIVPRPLPWHGRLTMSWHPALMTWVRPRGLREENAL